MKKFLLLCLISFFPLLAQSLVQTIPLPRYAYTDQGSGLCFTGGKLWFASGSTAAGNKGKIAAISATGVLQDSFTIAYPTINESGGIAHDGTNFWYLDRKTARTDIFKVSPTGVILDSIPITPLLGSNFILGGTAWDGSGLWVSVYYPDANVALYKIDVVNRRLLDTIRVNGLQPYGITVKGDTIFYVMDGFQGDAEKIYAVRLGTRDTLFSFHVPEQASLRQNPRGLAWDGRYLWLLAEPVGASVGRALFKFDLGGGGTPAINVITRLFELGNVQIDSIRSIDVQVRNYGTADLRIDSLRKSSSIITYNITLPLIIKPDSTKSFRVEVRPAENRAYTDSIMMFHNDPNFAYSGVTFKVKGIYTAPYLALSENTVAFGSKRFKSTSYKTLVISNPGSARLRVDSVRLKLPNYSFTQLSLPVMIDSQGSASFRLWFRPDAYRQFNDTLELFSNASNGTRIRLPVAAAGVPFDSALGNIMWRGVIPDNPNTSADDLSAKYFRKIKDINGDGVDDIVVCTDNYYAVCYNGNSSGWSDVLWAFNMYQSSNSAGSVERTGSLQIMEDITGDGVQEVLLGNAGGGESVFLVNGKTGSKIWEFGDSVNYDNGDINGIDCKRDFNNDGSPDILASASGNEFNGNGRFSVYCLDGRTGGQIWRIDESASKIMKDAVISTDAGGAISRHPSGSSSGTILGFNKLGQSLWSVNTARVVWTMDEIENIGGSPGKDIITGDFGGNVMAITADSGKVLWNISLGNIIIEELFVVPDMNGSGKQDILISALTGYAFLLEGRTGAVIWQSPTGGNVLGSGLLGDLNRDSIPEVGAGALDNKLYVFSGKNGASVFEYSFGTGANYPVEGVWGMDDLDKNGVPEFIAGVRNGEVVCFSGGVSPLTGAVGNGEVVPGQFTLEQNYPNPFNPSTTVGFMLPEAAAVRLSVFDILGREVDVMINDFLQAGAYKYAYQPANLASGVYVYRLKASGFEMSRKMVFLR